LENFLTLDLIRLNDLISESMKMVSPVSQLPLEIALVKFISDAIPVKSPDIKHEEAPEIKVEVEVKKVDKTPENKTTNVSAMDDKVWQKLLQNVREKNVSIEALLRAVKPLNYDGKNLDLGVYYQFHKDHLENIKNTKILEEICKETLGSAGIKITYQLIDRPVKKSNEPVESDVEPLTGKVDKDIIEAAKEIFS